MDFLESREKEDHKVPLDSKALLDFLETRALEVLLEKMA
jgi:hypothetical protein